MRSILLLAAIGSIGILALSPVQAEDIDNDENCIPIQHISNISVLGKQHIVFEMQPGKNYLNTLARSCNGLRKDKPIMYKTSISQLCSLDIIHVLESYGGGYQQGAACCLGKFSPASDDEVKALKAKLKQAKK